MGAVVGVSSKQLSRPTVLSIVCVHRRKSPRNGIGCALICWRWWPCMWGTFWSHSSHLSVLPVTGRRKLADCASAPSAQARLAMPVGGWP